MVQKRVTAQGWLGSTPEGQCPQIRGLCAGGSLAVASSIPATQLSSPARLAERIVTPHAPMTLGGQPRFPGARKGGNPAASGDLRLGHRAPGRGGRRASIPLPALTTLRSALGAFGLCEFRVSQQISTFYGPSVQTMETRLGARQRRRPPDGSPRSYPRPMPTAASGPVKTKRARARSCASVVTRKRPSLNRARRRAASPASNPDGSRLSCPA